MSDTEVYGTETPYRKTPPTNMSSLAEAAATGTPPSDAGVDPADAASGPTPQNTVAPVVTGTLVVADVLTCAPGTWVPAADSYTYQWYRSTGAAIEGATASTYTLVAGDVGLNIYCQVTGVETDYGPGAPVSSNSVGPVTAV